MALVHRHAEIVLQRARIDDDQDLTDEFRRFLEFSLVADDPEFLQAISRS